MAEAYLDWVSAELASAGRRALLLVWNHAPWHSGARVQAWLRAQNRALKRGDKRSIRLRKLLMEPFGRNGHARNG